MSSFGYERTFSGPKSTSALPPKADETEGSRRSPGLTVVSIDRRNTLIFDVTKKECWNELQTSDLFYE